MEENQVYFAEVSERLINSCDIVLTLDDGSALPAHSQIIARYSQVFADMLDGGPLAGASGLAKVDLPLSDCCKEDALTFLSIIYSPNPRGRIEDSSALSIARIAHKYGMKVCHCLTRQGCTSAFTPYYTHKHISCCIIWSPTCKLRPVWVLQDIVGMCDDALSELLSIREDTSAASLKVCFGPQ